MSPCIIKTLVWLRAARSKNFVLSNWINKQWPHISILSSAQVETLTVLLQPERGSRFQTKREHPAMRSQMMTHHAEFQPPARHQSKVKLITHGAVSGRQPGDIYLWTHVSNLAITISLINSLPESLPEEQKFTDSDRLMKRVSRNSVALKTLRRLALCTKDNSNELYPSKLVWWWVIVREWLLVLKTAVWKSFFYCVVKVFSRKCDWLLTFTH